MDRINFKILLVDLVTYALRDTIQTGECWQFLALANQLLDNNVDDVRQILLGLIGIRRSDLNDEICLFTT
jgi:hypothetical protein